MSGSIPSDETDSADTRTTSDGDDPSNRKHHKTTIGFAGDAMVGRGLNHIYGEKDVEPATIWGDFQPRLQSLDGVFCNLECSLSNRGDRFPDRVYYFQGDPEWAVPALTAGNVQFTALSNNHSMDFGAVALTDTIDVLSEAGIENAGTGKTPAAAWEPATFSVGGLDVAVVSFSDEYEFYAATDDRPGIAWAETDPENPETQRLVGNAIERAQSGNPDLLIVSVHWGKNWIERPSDQLVSFGHWLVDQGVDLVHGHSAHVVQAVEQYSDGVILHDTGNLVDDFGIKDDLGNDKSYLFEVTLTDGEFDKIRLVPFHIDDGVRPANKSEAAWLRKTMRDRSEPFETTYERDGDGLVVRL
ncbi:CapA family protein [Haladaptatus caseinilyticus]|uniref:CapA family protein n=1 Tax=Haladaptatus caseinilyticus TaxID=2993314 RepID=UPI00224A8312|nr:CapA family protein [Haladaptatus caseinilyticus]